MHAQDSLYYREILDSALAISDKADKIEFLKDKASKVPQSDQYFLGLINFRIGNIYGNQHELSLGESYYREGLKIGLKIDNDLLIGQGYLGIGGVQLIEQLQNTKKANYDSVIYYFNKSLPYLKKAKDTSNIEGLYANYSLILVNTGEFDSAKSTMIKTLKSRLDREDKLGVIGSLSNLGLFYRRNNNFPEALKFYQDAYKLAVEDSMLNEMAGAKLGMARLFNESGEHESAMLNYFQYDTLNKLSLNSEFQKQIAESETKYKTIEKQAEIDKKRRQIILLTIILFSILLISISGYLLIRQRRKAAKIASDKAIQDLLQNQEVQTTYAILEGQDKERKRVAAELHDSLGSILVTLNMYADTLQSNDKSENDLVRKISETAQLANEETRKISHSLDSGMLKHFGLEAAIKQLSEAVSTSRKIEFLSTILLQAAITTETSLEIYRIIQELVNNSLKHSHCTTIRLELNSIEDNLNLIYEDNGIGFLQSEITPGMGLRNIENRVSKLNGDLTIDSSPNKGSTFIIEIQPL